MQMVRGAGWAEGEAGLGCSCSGGLSLSRGSSGAGVAFQRCPNGGKRGGTFVALHQPVIALLSGRGRWGAVLNPD